MKIQLLSDTHSSPYTLHPEADVIAHAGDFGNGLAAMRQFQAACIVRNAHGYLKILPYRHSRNEPCPTPPPTPSHPNISTTAPHLLQAHRLDLHALPHARQIRLCRGVRHGRSRRVGALCRRRPNPHFARYPMGGTSGPYAQLGVLPSGRCRLLLRPARNYATCHRHFGY